MSKKTELLEQATKLGIKTDGLNITQLENAINSAPKPKVFDIKGNEIKEESKPVLPKPLTVTLEDVNSFLNVIGIVMIDDVRGNSLSSHFMKMIQNNNPQIQQNPQTPKT